jgi:hypothetical protein
VAELGSGGSAAKRGDRLEGDVFLEQGAELGVPVALSGGPNTGQDVTHVELMLN